MDRRHTLRAIALAASTPLVTPLVGCSTPQMRTVNSSHPDGESARLLDRVFMAHGGLDAWQKVERIDLTLSTNGFAFRMQGVADRVLHKRVSVFPRAFRTIIQDFPEHGSTGEWLNEKVAIMASDGSRQTRDNARMRFAPFVNRQKWDEFDLLYFVGYAIWNYLCFPFILNDRGLSIIAREQGGRPMLDVQFPEDYPTHSRQQYFMLDSNGLLLRHDYVAEVFGTWASAANFCQQSQSVGGLRFYTHRKVYPALGRSLSLPFPNLVWIEVVNVSVITN